MKIVEFGLKMKDMASGGLNKFGNNARRIFNTANSDADKLIAKNRQVSDSFGGMFKSMVGAQALVQMGTAAIAKIGQYVQEAQQASNIQQMAETKLATVMRQRIGATNEEIDSIKRLASEQQRIGVIGDEVQLSGTQQIATFVNQKKSLESLLPAMNNLLAQQKGLSATSEDAVNIGNMLGKAMQGQVAALSRVGITFSESEANMLKYANEEQRAATLAQIIENNVGKMNEALAATPEGKLKQMDNLMGDFQEKIGKSVISLKTAFLPIQQIALDFGNKLLPYIEKFTAYVSQLMSPSSQLYGYFSSIKSEFAGLADYANTYIKMIREGLLPVFMRVFGIVFDISRQIGLFIANSMLLKDIFNFVAGFFTTMYKVVGWVVDKLKWVFDNVVMPILKGIEFAYRVVTGRSSTLTKTGTNKPAVVKSDNKPETKEVLEKIATNTKANADVTKGANQAIAGGGPRVVNINVGKFFDNIVFNTTTLKETTTEIEQAVLNVLSRVTAQGAINS